jgi:peroxiredoxin Q/BCP
MARPLRPGERIPPFEANDAEGRAWSDRTLSGQAFVLFFYPADETPGCIREACAYRDAYGGFQALDVQLLGVSRDTADSHKAFAAGRSLPYPLLLDEEGRMHEAFGAFMLGGLPRRVSYLVDANSRIAGVYDSHLRPEAHAREMLAAARALLR